MTDTSARRTGTAWRLHGFSSPARPVAMALSDLPAVVERAARESGTTAGVEAVLRQWCDLVTSRPSLAPISARRAFGRLSWWRAIRGR